MYANLSKTGFSVKFLADLGVFHLGVLLPVEIQILDQNRFPFDHMHRCPFAVCTPLFDPGVPNWDSTSLSVSNSI